MGNSFLHTRRSKLIFFSVGMGWAILHACTMKGLGYSWEIAIWDSVVHNLLLFLIAMLVTVSFQFYNPRKNRMLYLIAYSALLAFLWQVLSRTVLSIFGFGNEAEHLDINSSSFILRLAFGFLILGCVSLQSVLYYTLQDQQEAERRSREAEKLWKDAELFKLRQQLQPHFLFNSLNSIHALISIQPEKARDMVLHLSDFLRGTLRKEERQWIRLEEELEHLQLYLDIEKQRFGHRLNTIISNTSQNKMLPSLILQPLVENAIKFGLYDTTDQLEIIIEATEAGPDLIITVSNPFDPQTSVPRKGTGFGLNSVQRRLYLLLNRNDLLSTKISDHRFSATIKIPQPYDQGIDN